MVRDHIRVRVNGVAHEVRPAATTTLLEWIRRDLRLTGSKEGCAEGDCGACTVVVAQTGGGRIRFRAANACILLMPMLDGASVTTVEGLATIDGGALNFVQKALVERHGSQCGFCAPGFVMVMFADRIDRLALPIDAALAGNLCRCTGYGPIAAAMADVRSEPLTASEVAWRDNEIAAVREMASDAGARLRGEAGDALIAHSLDAALDFLTGETPTTVVAGATDVGLWVTKQHRALPRTLFVNRLRELQTISMGDGILRLGGAVTYADAAEALAEVTPAFDALLRRIGGVQVRNAGTVGGNIANGSPIGDMPPCLIALDARVGLRSASGQRALPLEVFFIAYGKNARRPDELIEWIEVPAPRADALVKFYKVSKRADSDITAVLGAFNLTFSGNKVDSARIAFGGMAGVPARARRAEAAFVGRVFDAVAVTEAMQELDTDFQPISDLRASAGYRRNVARNLLLRLLAEHDGKPGPTQINDFAGWMG